MLFVVSSSTLSDAKEHAILQKCDTESGKRVTNTNGPDDGPKGASCAHAIDAIIAKIPKTERKLKVGNESCWEGEG